MSTFTAIAIMVALALVQRFLYGFDDRWIQNRRDAIVSGVIGGRPASTQDRWTLVYTPSGRIRLMVVEQQGLHPIRPPPYVRPAVA